MIAWAMGSATGHVAMAVWKEDDLFMCESNALSPYWPVNGIQCNTYDDWMEYGRRNGYNVVWAPLSRDLTESFNETAGVNFTYIIQADFFSDVIHSAILYYLFCYLLFGKIKGI